MWLVERLHFYRRSSLPSQPTPRLLSGHGLSGHGGTIRSLAFHTNGKLLTSGSDDQTVAVWDAQTRQNLHVLQGHAGAVHTVTFSPDGHLLASGDTDALIRLWNVRSGECTLIMRSDRPYEGMNIAGASGLTPPQRTALKALGAVDWD